MTQVPDTEILVAGTGPAGLITALLADEAGFDVTLVGPPVRLDDARTTTLMIPALEILQRLGIDPAFEGKAAPLETMRIVDGTRRLIRSPVATFHAGEIGEPYFGMNIPNSELNRALSRAAASAKLAWHEALVDEWNLQTECATAALENGKSISARLVAAADGRNSKARAAVGVTVTNRPYQQAAFVATLQHERPHGGMSTEFHTETGPFTIVPLPGNRSSLVWVVRPHEAEVLVALSAAGLSRQIEDRMSSMFGKISVEGTQQIYPLSSGLPSAFAAKRVALVGEAAHVFPPIGAQGLNLGVRDACDLIEVARNHRDDPGDPAVMTAYERARRPDILARTGAVSLLNQSLLTDFLPAQVVRGAGLAMLSSIAPLRGFFMREGMRPGSGISRLFSSVREQVRR